MKTFLVILTLLVMVIPVYASFDVSVDYSVGDGPNTIINADLDGDGDFDLAVTNQWSNTISILFNNGDGSFAADIQYMTGNRPLGIAAADFDSDGDLDLVTANYNSNNMSVLLNNGNGTFSAPIHYPAQKESGGIAVGDFDNDGDLDIAVSNCYAGTVSVFLNNGNAVFAISNHYRVAVEHHGWPLRIRTADFDSNGYLDLVTVNNTAGDLSIIFNNGDGTFGTAVKYFLGSYPSDLEIYDLDHDGDLDIATSLYGSEKLTMLYNNGDGTFVINDEYFFAVGTSPTSLIGIYLDDDNLLDFIVTGSNSNEIYFLQNINGLFTEIDVKPVGIAPNNVISGDYDGSGNLDLAITNTESDNITLILNSSKSCNNILFAKAPLNSVDYDMYQQDIDGVTSNLVLDDGGDQQMFHWSNDLSKIVYSTNDGSTTGQHELFVMDSDGTNNFQLTSFGDYWGQSYPRFVDENTIWWARPQIDEICSINIDGSGYEVLTNFNADGKSVGQMDIRNDLIVYSKQSKSVASSYDIYSNNLSFTNEQRLTSNSIADAGPEISPDGSKILFIRSTASDGYSSPKNIFIMNADGTNQTQLTFATGSQTYGHPLWSEDGSRILCYYRDGSQNDIYSFYPDGSGFTNITNTPDFNEAPYDWRNFCQSETEGIIAGTVSTNSLGKLGVTVTLFNEASEVVGSIYTDELGYYEFIELPAGTYTVSMETPLGFTSDNEVQEVIVNGLSYEVNFDLTEGTSDKLCHIWWWKVYLDDLRNDGPRDDVFTKEDVNLWLQRIFNHYYSRLDNFAIQIENATYKGVSAQPLTFDDLAVILLDTHEGTYESYVRKNLLINLLNVASGKMLQTKVVTADSATASQAITYFYQVYEANKNESNFEERNNLIVAYLNLRNMFMGQMISAGIVPLTTPNVMYKGATDGDTDDLLPSGFALNQNYPNPFNPTTEISFSLPEASNVKLEVYNINGQVVTTLADGQFEAGVHQLTWDGRETASGMYFYKLTTNNFSETKKMLLLK